VATKNSFSGASLEFWSALRCEDQKREREMRKTSEGNWFRTETEFENSLVICLGKNWGAFILAATSFSGK
jgi:hypothetical protein